MQITPSHTHYQLVYISFDISSFSVISYITIYLIVVMYSIFIPLQIGSITPDFFTLGIYLLLVFSNISGFAPASS